MVIKASAASEIRALVQSLTGSDEVRREAAIARLAVIGPRAVPHILDAYAGASERRVRVALLRALEPVADPRAAGVAREALAEGGDLGVAAIPVLRTLLEGPHAAAEHASLDALITVALDERAERRLRVAALEVLETVPSMRERLPASGLHALRAGERDADGARHAAVWQDALDGRLPDDPGPLRDAASALAPGAPLGDVHKLIERIRGQERVEPHSAAGWRALRGSLHHALALRASRVAIRDLRDTLSAAGPDLPPSFLSAGGALGDESFLEPLAAAWAAHDDARWRGLVAAAFRAIAARERLTRRHAVMKRVLKRWPEAGERLTGR